MQRVFSTIAATLALSAAAITYAHAAPAHTISRYMSTVKYATLYNEGCSMGNSGVSGAVILDFGQPDYSGAEGATVFGNFASDSEIVTGVKGFLDGFWNCSPGSAQLHLAVGTSNHGTHVGSSAGTAWAKAVNSLSSYISTKGYGGQEYIRGAIDAEPGWDTEFTRTQNWVDAYNAATSKPLYDYGSADDCPYSGNPSGGCDGWGRHGLWYIAWGNADAVPIPEIYYSSMADEWYNESLYSFNTQDGPIGFLGTMTQYAACGQSSGCNQSATFTPAGGFNALQNLINGNSDTSHTMSYSTDISWAN
jgi:hypothetical protein